MAIVVCRLTHEATSRENGLLPMAFILAGWLARVVCPGTSQQTGLARKKGKWRQPPLLETKP